MPEQQLQGKVIVVTGGSSGIGRHLCAALRARGASVVALSRTATGAAIDADLCVDADVADEASLGVAFRQIGARWPGVDALVNNAGIAHEMLLSECSPADWARVIATNLTGPFLVARAAYPLLAKAKGAVINISSVAAIRPMRRLGAYGAAKAGLLQLTKVMALEFARDGVRANAVVPGYIRTAMNEEFLVSAAGERLVQSIPLREPGSVADIENAVAWLASDASRYVTGTALTVDGGFLLR
jgi:NAD(P)-dependent dehydrogenase (short-subunit alcohol dehydrogenase family)